MWPVGNDDEAQFLVEFANRATGHIETSRIATGSKMDITYEITGTKGAIAFDGERMNELQVYTADQPREIQGFARVYAGPAHPPFGNFVPATGHGLSFNDQKTIEIARLMDGIGAGRPAWPDLKEAAAIGRILDAVLTCSDERRWVEVM